MDDVPTQLEKQKNTKHNQQASGSLLPALNNLPGPVDLESSSHSEDKELEETTKSHR